MIASVDIIYQSSKIETLDIITNANKHGDNDKACGQQ